MRVVLDDNTPIFQQIYEMIEDDIVDGELKEGDQIISTTEISKFYQVNRATAQKGIQMLIERGYAYKQRGVGIFVASGAAERIRETRRDAFHEAYIKPLLEESKRLKITKAELMQLIEEDNDD